MGLVFFLYGFLLLESCMEWALGVSLGTSSIEVFTSNEGIEHRRLEEIASDRLKVPRTTKPYRVLYEGSLSSWSLSDPGEYLAGVGIELPEGCLNRHEIFKFVDGGLTVQVPTLVLMQAFFKPSPILFPAAFKMAGPDLLAYVDYAQATPVVVIDDLAYIRHTRRCRENTAPNKPLEWLHLSKSAKNAMHSVYLGASNGTLRMSLPLGDFRIALHGPRVGNQVFATTATLIAMTIPAEDSVTGASETMIFHSMADPQRRATASAGGINIPLHADGTSSVTDQEWQMIEPILTPKFNAQKIIHSRRHLLDAILLKLSSGIWWAKVPTKGFSISDLSWTFRRWKTEGLFDQVLEVLNASRSNGPRVESITRIGNKPVMVGEKA
ncbi:Transposase IS5 family [Herminiimonas arsenicoxydans]|uniref:Transposase IS5 family n=1 Tax=Herminiimonas arsenicoxydans TaxID=204773 RepID=A4G765_HERAR|nr:Transposase IS5 family [Herminiimonas arsenicoxydans]